jgi:hypothetical protein
VSTGASQTPNVRVLTMAEGKPHVVKDGIGGTWPWTARVNPGSGMFTAARRFPTWQEAFDWLCDQIWSDPEPWVVVGNGYEQRLSDPGDNESRWTPTHAPRTRAEYRAEHERGNALPGKAE